MKTGEGRSRSWREVVAELEEGQVKEQRQPADAVRRRYCSLMAALPKLDLCLIRLTCTDL